MKQGNPTKKFGIIALINAMISGMASRPADMEHKDLIQRRTYLLTNGGVAPILRECLTSVKKEKETGS